MGIRMIATDMDGTLLRSDHRTVSPRTLRAFADARAAGIEVLAMSGRQPYSIGAILAGSILDGVVVGSNGAVGMDVPSRRVLFEECMEVEAQRAFAHAFRARVPGATFRTVRSAGNEYVIEHGSTGHGDPGADVALWTVTHRRADLDEVLAEPSIKLVVHAGTSGLTAEGMLEVARDLEVEGCHATTTGAPFLEVGRAGVTKASALARVCTERGIEAHEVVAFGDNLNDVEMLRWAGHGVAMANAVPGAKEVADEVTLHHDADGVAVVIERLLG